MCWFLGNLFIDSLDHIYDKMPKLLVYKKI